MSTTATKVRRGPRYPKSPPAFRGQSALVCRAGLSETSEGAKKSLQRLQEKLMALASAAARYPELKGRLRRMIAPVVQVLERGVPLPWSAGLLVDTGHADATEDVKKLQLVARPDCVKTLAEWIASAHREADAQAEAIASAELRLAELRMQGGVQ